LFKCFGRGHSSGGGGGSMLLLYQGSAAQHSDPSLPSPCTFNTQHQKASSAAERTRSNAAEEAEGVAAR